MRRIFTLSAIIALTSAFAFNVAAQTCTANTTNPGNLGTNRAITTPNGFTSTGQTTPFTYPASATSSITSPIYFYNTAQSTINFSATLTPANGANPSFTPTIQILYGNPSSPTVISCTTAAVNLTANTADQQVFFSITPTTPFPASVNFQVRLTFANGPRNITATQFAIETDANLAPTGAALPVRISGFELRKSGSGVIAIWNTETEENVSHYEVERSVDGARFTKIGSVPAAGARSYTFTDAAPVEGYYRIRSIDHDGKFGQSPIVRYRAGKAGVVVKAFPSPVRSTLTIQHEATSNGRITISGENGQLIRTVVPAAGNQQTVIDLSSVRAGLYLVRFENGNGETETLKVIKQ